MIGAYLNRSTTSSFLALIITNIGRMTYGAQSSARPVFFMAGARWLHINVAPLHQPSQQVPFIHSLTSVRSSISLGSTATTTSSTRRGYRLTPKCEMPHSPVTIPLDRIEFSFTKSSGPGGQNVNKLNTRAELRFHVESADWIPQGMRQRLADQQRHRINKVGELVISSQEHRTQLKNREDCISKLRDALYQASIIPKERNMRTGLTEWEKENRLREKKKRSETKSARRQKGKWDD